MVVDGVPCAVIFEIPPAVRFRKLGVLTQLVWVCMMHHTLDQAASGNALVQKSTSRIQVEYRQRAPRPCLVLSSSRCKVDTRSFELAVVADLVPCCSVFAVVNVNVRSHP